METAKEITEIIDKRVEVLREVAKSAADDYWTLRLEGNKDHKAKSNLGCRVAARGTQFAISWFTNSYHKKANDDVDTYSTHLRKGRTSSRYPETTLRKSARDWEFKHVQIAEEIFAAVREELSVLGKMRRTLAAQTRLAEKVKNLTPHYDDLPV